MKGKHTKSHPAPHYNTLYIWQVAPRTTEHILQLAKLGA